MATRDGDVGEWGLGFSAGLYPGAGRTARRAPQPGGAEQPRSIVLSIHSLVFFGGVSLGSSVMGVIADTAGAPFAMALAGVVTAVAAGACFGVAAAQRRGAKVRTVSEELAD